MKDPRHYKIDSLFKSGLENKSVAPPDAIWDAIESELHGKKGGKRFPMFLLMVAACSGLLFASGYLGWHFQHDYNELVPGNIVQENVGELNTDNQDSEIVQSLLEKTVKNEDNKNLKNKRDNKNVAIKVLQSQRLVSQSFQEQEVEEEEKLNNEAKKLILSDLKTLVRNTKTEKPEKENTLLENYFIGLNKGNIKKEKASDSKSLWALGGQFSPNKNFSGLPMAKADFEGLRNLDGGGGSSGFVEDFLGNPISPFETVSQGTEEGNKDLSSLSLGELTPEFSYTAGLRLGYGLSGRLALQSGLFFGIRKFSSPAVVSGETGDAELRNEYTLQYLEIPLQLQFDMLSGKRLSWYLSSGVAADFFLNYESKIVAGSLVEDYTLDDEPFLKPFQLNMLLSTGINYELAENWSFFLEPAIRFALYNNSAFVNGFASSNIGINTGFYYHF